jgi:hypothetical protein
MSCFTRLARPTAEKADKTSCKPRSDWPFSFWTGRKPPMGKSLTSQRFHLLYIVHGGRIASLVLPSLRTKCSIMVSSVWFYFREQITPLKMSARSSKVRNFRSKNVVSVNFKLKWVGLKVWLERLAAGSVSISVHPGCLENQFMVKKDLLVFNFENLTRSTS